MGAGFGKLRKIVVVALMIMKLWKKTTKSFDLFLGLSTVSSNKDHLNNFRELEIISVRI